MTNRIEINSDEKWKREELQQMADILQTKITYSGELDGGFEQCAFTPKSLIEAQKLQPRLFEDEDK